MRNLLALSVLALAAASQAVTVVTVQDLVDFPDGHTSQQVFGTIDNTAGTAPITSVDFSIAPGTTVNTLFSSTATGAGTFGASAPLPIGQTYTGLLGTINYVRNSNGGPGKVAFEVGAYSGASAGASGFSNQVNYGAVPEPASLAALGLGAAALMRRRVRRG